MAQAENSRSKAQEFNDKLKEVAKKLGITDKETIMNIEFKDNIKLGGNLERDDIFVVKIKGEDESIYHIVIDKDINKIATIGNDGKVELSEAEKKIWEQYIGKKGNQRPDQKSIYDFDKEYILDEYVMEKDELDKSEKDTKKRNEKSVKRNNSDDKTNEDDKNKIAKSLKVKEESIISIVKIEDRETFGQAINKKLEADAYIVKYGNNKIKIMQGKSIANLKEISGIEQSEFSSEVLEQLNADKPGSNQKIKAGDLVTIKDKDKNCNYVVVRENDPDKGIVIVNTSNSVETYTFNDKDKETLSELKSSIIYAQEKNNDENDDQGENEGNNEPIKSEEKKIEEEDEERTPWRDAESRRYRG